MGWDSVHTIQVNIYAPRQRTFALNTITCAIQLLNYVVVVVVVVACAVIRVRLWAICAIVSAKLRWTWTAHTDAYTPHHVQAAQVYIFRHRVYWLVLSALICPSDNITLYLIIVVRKVNSFVCRYGTLWSIADYAFYLHGHTLPWTWLVYTDTHHSVVYNIVYIFLVCWWFLIDTAVVWQILVVQLFPVRGSLIVRLFWFYSISIESFVVSYLIVTLKYHNTGRFWHFDRTVILRHILLAWQKKSKQKSDTCNPLRRAHQSKPKDNNYILYRIKWVLYCANSIFENETNNFAGCFGATFHSTVHGLRRIWCDGSECIVQNKGNQLFLVIQPIFSVWKR